MAHRIVDNAETSPPGPVADAAHPAGRGRPAVAVSSPVTAVAVNRRGRAAVVEPAVQNVERAVTRRGPGGPEARMCRRRVAVPAPAPAEAVSHPPVEVAPVGVAVPAPRGVPARPRPGVARPPDVPALRRQAGVRAPQGVVAPPSQGAAVPRPPGVVAPLPDVAGRPVARGPADVRGAALRPVRARPRGPVAHRN